MRHLLFFIFIMFTIVSAADVKKMDIYICIGQSNMAGRAKLDKKREDMPSSCYLLNSDLIWVKASHPFNQYSTIRKDIKLQKLGVAYGFARTMCKYHKGKDVGLIVQARGGSKIDQWKKGSNYYNELIKRIKAVKNSGTIRGVIWHQGESDEKNKKYLEELKVFICELRKEIGNKKLPFVVGEVNKVPLINKQLNELPKQCKYTAVVSAKKLKTIDRWHFNAKSQLILGKSYADAMLLIIKNIIKVE